MTCQCYRTPPKKLRLGQAGSAPAATGGRSRVKLSSSDSVTGKLSSDSVKISSDSVKLSSDSVKLLSLRVRLPAGG